LIKTTIRVFGSTTVINIQTSMRAATKLIAAALLIALSAFGQDKKPEPKYEMDNYVVAILRRGPTTSQNKEEAAKIQAAHMAHIGHMASIGKLVVAGPFTANNTDARGMFIFKATLEEAKSLTEQDPAVKAGRLVMDLYPWFAGKGLKVDPPK
jgi:uncharacterized protein YciI